MVYRPKRVMSIAALALWLPAALALPAWAQKSGPVVVAKIDGPILPPTEDYYTRAVSRAEQDHATLLLVEMDTPGGLLTSMRAIARMNLRSSVPVVVYITPSGARAGSAGAVIALSANLIAMAPGTNIGAAHPVEGGGDLQGDMRDKVTNDAAAFARSLAQQRGKSVKWAEDIVRRSISVSDSEAYHQHVADLLAPDRAALLRELNGRVVHTAAGPVTISTAGSSLDFVNHDWGESLRMFLYDPTVALIFWVLAMYGIIAELNHPGAILPGVAGAISLVLALLSMSVLSVTGAGIALLVVSAVLFTTDVYATTHGVLTAGGLIAFIAGGLLLFNPTATGVTVAPSVVIGLGLFSALFFGVVVGAAVRIRRRPPGGGPESLIGSTAVARSAVSPKGRVFTQGAFWSAINVGVEPIGRGDTVVIEGRDGLTLKVRRTEPAPVQPGWDQARGNPA